MELTLSAASGITSPLESHVILYKVSLLSGSPNDGGEHKNGVTFWTNTEQPDGPF